MSIVTVTRSALEKRIRRKLRHEAMILHKDRDGRYWVINDWNHPVNRSTDLEEIAKDLGCLHEGEEMVE